MINGVFDSLYLLIFEKSKSTFAEETSELQRKELIVLCGVSVQNDLDYSTWNTQVIPPLTCNECLKILLLIIFCGELCAGQNYSQVMKQQQIYVSFPIVIDERYGKTHSARFACSLSILLQKNSVEWAIIRPCCFICNTWLWLYNCSNSHINAYSTDKQVWTDWLAVFFSNYVSSSNWLRTIQSFKLYSPIIIRYQWFVEKHIFHTWNNLTILIFHKWNTVQANIDSPGLFRLASLPQQRWLQRWYPWCPLLLQPQQLCSFTQDQLLLVSRIMKILL